MKKSFIILCCTLLNFQNLTAQAIERSFSAGYHSFTRIVKPYGEDKWLIAGYGAPEPGVTDRDTLFIAIVGNDGQTYLRKNMTLPATNPNWLVHYWHDIMALPDGGILTSFQTTYCDGAFDIVSTQRLDAQGNIVWELLSGGSVGVERLPEQWGISPDGKLIGTDGHKVWKLEINTGAILSKVDLEGVSSGFNVSNSFYHIPDTEDFFAFGYPSFQLWHKSGSSTFPKYTMVKSLDLPNYYFYHKLVEGSDGWFYFYRESEKQFERINYELQHEVLFKLDLLNDFIDYSLSGSNLIYSIHSGTGIYKISQYNIPSKVQSDLLSGGPHRVPWQIATKNGWLALAGVDISRNLSATPEWARCSAAWLNVFPITNPSVVEALPNASINEIEQTYALDTAGVNYFSQGYFYNISGGGFKVKLTNSGQSVIDQVYVNVAFRRNNFVGFCFTHSTEQKRFSNLNLPPSESMWLDFGDIQARGQVAVPAEICFWTSSPNEQPDADQEDDLACLTSSYTVATKEPDFPQASLSPNPADAFVDIAFSEKMDGEKWQLFDAIGRLLQFGISPNGQVLRLETKHLTNGIYLIRFGGTMLKLVVQH
jgi:hypothetical protein